MFNFVIGVLKLIGGVIMFCGECIDGLMLC